MSQIHSKTYISKWYWLYSKIFIFGWITGSNSVHAPKLAHFVDHLGQMLSQNVSHILKIRFVILTWKTDEFCSKWKIMSLIIWSPLPPSSVHPANCTNIHGFACYHNIYGSIKISNHNIILGIFVFSAFMNVNLENSIIPFTRPLPPSQIAIWSIYKTKPRFFSFF